MGGGLVHIYNHIYTTKNHPPHHRGRDLFTLYTLFTQYIYIYIYIYYRYSVYIYIYTLYLHYIYTIYRTCVHYIHLYTTQTLPQSPPNTTGGRDATGTLHHLGKKGRQNSRHVHHPSKLALGTNPSGPSPVQCSGNESRSINLNKWATQTFASLAMAPKLSDFKDSKRTCHEPGL